MNNQLHNQIKQLSDRELLEGIYQMLLVVMQEQLISASYFSIFTEANTIAYNARNVDGKTYIDGELNESIIVDNLLKKKTIITIVNNSVDSEKTGRPSFFSTYNNLGYFANLAFYNSIGFDSVPTKQNDGFTEQDLIDYVLENLITK